MVICSDKGLFEGLEEPEFLWFLRRSAMEIISPISSEKLSWRGVGK